MLTFHNFKNGMTVMDGLRCIAKAQPVGIGGWLLTLHGASWVDKRPVGIVPGAFPNIMHVANRHEAAQALRAIANQGAK